MFLYEFKCKECGEIFHDRIEYSGRGTIKSMIPEICPTCRYMKYLNKQKEVK